MFLLPTLSIDRTSYIVCSGHQWRSERLLGMCAWWLPGRDKHNNAPYHGLGVMLVHLHVALPATAWSNGGQRDSVNLPSTSQRSDSGLHPQCVLQMWQLRQTLPTELKNVGVAGTQEIKESNALISQMGNLRPREEQQLPPDHTFIHSTNIS